jgi:hypothetical protein
VAPAARERRPHQNGALIRRSVRLAWACPDFWVWPTAIASSVGADSTNGSAVRYQTQAVRANGPMLRTERATQGASSGRPPHQTKRAQPRRYQRSRPCLAKHKGLLFPRSGRGQTPRRRPCSRPRRRWRRSRYEFRPSDPLYPTINARSTTNTATPTNIQASVKRPPSPKRGRSRQLTTSFAVRPCEGERRSLAEMAPRSGTERLSLETRANRNV